MDPDPIMKRQDRRIYSPCNLNFTLTYCICSDAKIRGFESTENHFDNSHEGLFFLNLRSSLLNETRHTGCRCICRCRIKEAEL